MLRVDNSKCDFCSALNPRWSFPARDFYHKSEVEPLDQVFIHAFMYEEWAACDVCAMLIHRGENVALAERIYIAPDVANSIHAKIFRKEMLSQIIKMQDRFRDSRLPGPPVLIT
jgi:hypothetical protein